MSWAEVAKKYAMPADHDLKSYKPLEDKDWKRFTGRNPENYRDEYRICKKCDTKFTKGSESGFTMWYVGVLNLEWTNKFIPPKKCATYCMEKVLE